MNNLIAKTDSDEVIWYRRVDALDPWGAHRHAQFDDHSFDLGLLDLSVYGEHRSLRIAACTETTRLDDAIEAQAVRLTRDLLETATSRLGLVPPSTSP